MSWFGLAVRLVSRRTPALLSLQKGWFVDTVLLFHPSLLTVTLKMALIAAHLNAGIILVVAV